MPFSGDHFHFNRKLLFFINKETWIDYLCFYSSYWKQWKAPNFLHKSFKVSPVTNFFVCVILNIFSNSNFRRNEISSKTISRQNVTVH